MKKPFDIPKSPHRRPILSVVICTYNNADALARVIAHLEAQCTKAEIHFSTIVIDNNCTDHTAAVVHAAQARGVLPELRYFIEQQQGQVYARVRGVIESDSEWIAFVDDDNLLQAGWIQSALDFIAAHPRCGAFGGRIVIDWETNPSDTIKKHSYAYARLDLGKTAKKLTGENRWHLRGAGLVCRKQALISSGWLEWRVCVGRQGGVTTAGDDLEMVMRIAREGHEIWYEPACRMLHQISAGRINQPYLEKLHFGFGLAEPVLRGLKKRQSFATWFGELTFGCSQRFLRATRESIVSFFQSHPQSRERARIHWAYFNGMINGVRPAFQMESAVRRGWLGQSTTPSPVPNKPASA